MSYSYGVAAHKYAAEAGYAPKMLGSKVVSSSLMVVMKKLEGKCLHKIEATSLSLDEKKSIAQSLE